MSMPDRVSPDLELPEQHLLRDGDRMQDYAGAFLRGEITAEQYSELTLAEINRRAPLDPLLPLGDPSFDPGVPEGREPEPRMPKHRAPDEPGPPAVPEAEVEVGVDVDAEVEPARSQRSERDRATVLAEAFVSGHIRGADFLRLIRDC